MISPSTPRENLRKFWNIYRAIALALITAALGACDLDTSAIPPWDTSAAPAYVCPGDPVRLSWDTTTSCGGGSCGDVTVNISSSPLTALGGARFTSHDATGFTSSGPIAGSTTFSFSGSIDRGRFGPYDHSVDVVLPDRTTTVRATIEGNCDGGWDLTSLAAGEFRSSGVRIVSIRNLSGFAIDLVVNTSSLGTLPTIPLRNGQSTPDFDATVGNKITTVTATSPDFDPSVTIDHTACITDGTGRSPTIVLDVVLTCDLSSASEAIVAGTPEADDTPEEAFIFTNTPPATPKITTTRTANCRGGPNDVFDIVTVLNEGFQSEPNGRDWQSTWWRILTPDGLNFCWVSDSVVDFEGPSEDVAVIESPPTPAVGCLIYDESTPNDLTDTTCVPRACTDQDQPGASCTP